MESVSWVEREADGQRPAMNALSPSHSTPPLVAVPSSELLGALEALDWAIDSAKDSVFMAAVMLNYRAKHGGHDDRWRQQRNAVSRNLNTWRDLRRLRKLCAPNKEINQ